MVSLTKSSQIASHAGAHMRDPGHGGGVARPKVGMRCASEPVWSANGPRRTRIATTLWGVACQPPEAAGSNNRPPLDGERRAQAHPLSLAASHGRSCVTTQRGRLPGVRVRKACGPLRASLAARSAGKNCRFWREGALRSGADGNGHARIRLGAWKHVGLHRALLKGPCRQRVSVPSDEKLTAWPIDGIENQSALIKSFITD
jgi:hypothetical protein